MKTRQIVIVAVAISIVASAFLFSYFMKPKEVEEEEKLVTVPTKYVLTSKVKYSDIESEVVAFGRLKAMKRAEIYSEVQGIMDVTYDKFEIGNYFNKGDILIKLDDTDAKLNLLSQRSAFLNSLSNLLADIKIEFPDQFKEWESYIDNFDIESNLNDLPEVEQKKLKYFLSGRNIFTQFYNIKNLEFRLSKYNIEAPFSGVVVQSMIEPGTLVRPGMKLGEIAGTGTYELDLSVNTFDAQFLSNGNQVKVVNELNSKEYVGRVNRIGKSIDPTTQTVQVFLTLSGSDLKEGQYLKGVINGETLEEVFQLPRRALINNEKVYFAENGTLQETDVRVIKLSDNTAFVKGLDEGTDVIIQPITNATIGMPVKIVEEKLTEDK